LKRRSPKQAQRKNKKKEEFPIDGIYFITSQIVFLDRGWAVGAAKGRFSIKKHYTYKGLALR